jgi:hypothetical protein
MGGWQSGIFLEATAMRMKSAAAILIAILASASGAFAQGCALCYTSASAAGAAGLRSLDYGILALLTPALVLFLSVMFLLYRRAVSASA